MAFKTGFIYMVPDADPKVHRATIKTAKSELNVVAVPMDNIDQAVSVCQDSTQSFHNQE